MANVLTGLLPTVYASLDVVSRELTGMITAVTIDSDATVRGAVGQTCLIPLAPAAIIEDIVAGPLPANTGDQTIGNVPIVLTKARDAAFKWTGEEVRGLNTGAGFNAIKNGQIAQAFRGLCNEIEADLTSLYFRSSRAFGTAGTPALATDLSQAAEIAKILKDNGAPPTDLQLIINTTSGVNLLKQTQLTKANEAGSDTFLRQGIMLPIFGMDIRESAQVKNVVKGTGINYVTTGVHAIGATSIALVTGTGTINAGDIVTFAADTNNKYVVTAGIAAPGSISIGAPGLRVSIPAANALAVGANYAANMAFHRSAMVLAMRAPALPEGGDSAVDREMIVDPRSSLVFELSAYRQYKQTKYELAAVWGFNGIKPEHAAILLG
jgi:hypothetical protein